MRRRKPRWDGWYVCEWRCGKRYRRAADYAYHCTTKHAYSNGVPHPWPEEALT